MCVCSLHHQVKIDQRDMSLVSAKAYHSSKVAVRRGVKVLSPDRIPICHALDQQKQNALLIYYQVHVIIHLVSYIPGTKPKRILVPVIGSLFRKKKGQYVAEPVFTWLTDSRKKKHFRGPLKRDNKGRQMRQNKITPSLAGVSLFEP